jgi:hypothetical protein
MIYKIINAFYLLYSFYLLYCQILMFHILSIHNKKFIIKSKDNKKLIV